MAGTIYTVARCEPAAGQVSMESGLDGRNNGGVDDLRSASDLVSMESGLDGRNNPASHSASPLRALRVSMESGLDGRNNERTKGNGWKWLLRLNGVRPRWPEQSLTRGATR